jgi:hypothetical protein
MCKSITIFYYHKTSLTLLWQMLFYCTDFPDYNFRKICLFCVENRRDFDFFTGFKSDSIVFSKIFSSDFAKNLVHTACIELCFLIF